MSLVSWSFDSHGLQLWLLHTDAGSTHSHTESLTAMFSISLIVETPPANQQRLDLWERWETGGEKMEKTSKTKDYREMSRSHGGINQGVAFFSNGKLRPQPRSLSITEIELPPY